MPRGPSHVRVDLVCAGEVRTPGAHLTRHRAGDDGELIAPWRDSP